jgi:DNA-binding NtrC family response regulator
MPKKDGIETILAMRRIDKTARIIAMSGGGRMGNMNFLEAAKQLGASETLSKPFDRECLLTIVRQLLDRPQDTARRATPSGK